MKYFEIDNYLNMFCEYSTYNTIINFLNKFLHIIINKFDFVETTLKVEN